MAQPVPDRRASASASPYTLTPSGTPPHCDPATESRLHQLLSHFDAGTHQFCREERETPAERRQSFGSNSDVFPTPPPSRRPSFLSGLAIRPFTSSSPSSSSPAPASTPLSASLSASHPKELFSHPLGLGMTSSDAPLTPPSARPPLEKLSTQYQSTSVLPHDPMDAPLTAGPGGPGGPGGMSRSKTTGHTPSKQSGFVLNKQLAAGRAAGKDAAAGLVEKHGEEARRHFDPSRDPKLLGLI